MSPEDRRVLAVGAHPDDVEILCAGTLFLLRELGCEVHVATMSLGDCGSMEYSAEETRRMRRGEAERACQMLDATYHYVGLNDFGIFNDDGSNRRTAALVRDVDPRLVITHPPQDYMSDHEVTSVLVRNACFVAAAPNYDTSGFTLVRRSSAIPYLFYTQPIEGTDIFGRRVTPEFYIDVSDYMERKAEMLACHESQRTWLRAHHGVDEYVETMRSWHAELGQRAAALSGKAITHAEAFREHRGHSYPHDNVLAALLPGRVVEEADYR